MIRIPSPRTRRRARIEIIPLIDIIFFLLATFAMVSLSMIQNRGIAVRLPPAETGVAIERERSVSISIAADGAIYWDREPIDAAELDAALAALAVADPDARVFVSGDERAALGRAVEVLDHVRRAGIASVAIETRPKRP